MLPFFLTNLPAVRLKVGKEAKQESSHPESLNGNLISLVGLPEAGGTQAYGNFAVLVK